MKNPLEDPIAAACDEIKFCQIELIQYRIPCNRSQTLVEALEGAIKAKEYSWILEHRLGDFLLMLGRFAFTCHSSVYTILARHYRIVNPHRLDGDTEYADKNDLRTIAHDLPNILETLSDEWAIRPPSVGFPDFSGIDAYDDFVESCAGEPYSRADYPKTVSCIFEFFEKIFNQLDQATESFKAGIPPRVDDVGDVDFKLLAEMAEQSAEYGHFQNEGDEWVHVDTSEYFNQQKIIGKTMALVDAIRDYVARKKSSCAADLMTLEPMLKAQEGGIHQEGFSEKLKALMEALWREFVTPERPIIIEGGKVMDGRVRPGPKVSTSKLEQVAMGVSGIMNEKFRNPIEAARHIVGLALPKWAKDGYGEKDVKSLAQAIRRQLRQAQS